MKTRTAPFDTCLFIGSSAWYGWFPSRVVAPFWDSDGCQRWRLNSKYSRRSGLTVVPFVLLELSMVSSTETLCSPMMVLGYIGPKLCISGGVDGLIHKFRTRFELELVDSSGEIFADMGLIRVSTAFTEPSFSFVVLFSSLVPTSQFAPELTKHVGADLCFIARSKPVSSHPCLSHNGTELLNMNGLRAANIIA